VLKDCETSTMGLIRPASWLQSAIAVSLLGAMLSTTAADDTGCPVGFSNATSGFCYATVSANGGLNWYDSLAACAALGASAGAVRATLASVRDPPQWDIVFNKVCAGLEPLDAKSRQQSVWIGFWNENSASSRQFVSGTDPQFFLSTAPWSPGEPTSGVEHCTQMPAGRVALNDTVCSLAQLPTVGNQQMAGCCEAPVQPVNTCPDGFAGPNAAGFCYRGLNFTSGIFWNGASTACRGLGSDSTLAAIIDAATADSVVIQRCAGTLPAEVTAYWTGIQDTTAQLGHANRSASYWRNCGSGHSNDWFISQGCGRPGSPAAARCSRRAVSRRRQLLAAPLCTMKGAPTTPSWAPARP
jgi:hypothetical protein